MVAGQRVRSDHKNQLPNTASAIWETKQPLPSAKLGPDLAKSRKKQQGGEHRKQSQLNEDQLWRQARAPGQPGSAGYPGKQPPVR